LPRVGVPAENGGVVIRGVVVVVRVRAPPRACAGVCVRVRVRVDRVRPERRRDVDARASAWLARAVQVAGDTGGAMEHLGQHSM